MDTSETVSKSKVADAADAKDKKVALPSLEPFFGNQQSMTALQGGETSPTADEPNFGATTTTNGS